MQDSEIFEIELDSSIESDDENVVPGNTTETERSAAHLYVFFILMFQTLFRVSDAALNVLLSFFMLFLQKIAQIFHCEKLEDFSAKLPRNIHSARSITTDSRNNFTRYACCPRCSSIYEWNPNTTGLSDSCENIAFPDHPQAHHRKACGKKIHKKVKTITGKTKHRPISVYCYKSIIESLREMIKCPGFIDKCEQWRKREKVSGKYRDIYDGKIWEEFQVYNDKPFLSLPYNFAFQLNIDWFQPFKHTQHSEGVIYLSIMNLPRQERFLQENTILVGVIPGPNEPKGTVNSFLEPMVNDLLKLWEGVILERNIVRGALLCAGCDIPAARKTCGFVGHSARLGCSKCLLEFPTAHFGEKPDYTNFERSNWIPRSDEHHRLQAEAYKQAKTRSAQLEIERESGVRYSVLLKLPYFNAPRMCIIDPMHNLFLGIAKKFTEILKFDKEFNDKLGDVQNKVNAFITPKGLGRLPSKISSGFAGFTAEQWKNWILFFSSYSLKGMIPGEHYQCWQLFSKACFYMCRREIRANELELADSLLEEFCRYYVSLFGKDHCTINLHLSCHLSECVRDYGPVYSFWLFAYERLNGILGSYHTNNRSISIQLTRRFLDSKIYSPSKWPSEFVSEFLPLIEHCQYQQGSLSQTSLEMSMNSNEDNITPLHPIHECVWKKEELLLLEKMVKLIHASSEYKIQILMVTKRANAVVRNGFIFPGASSRHCKSKLCLVKSFSGDIVLAEIVYYSECHYETIRGNCEPTKHSTWLIAAELHMDHPCKAWYGYPSQVWSCTKRSSMHFIPISRFVSRVVYTKATVHFGGIYGCIPVIIATPIECDS